MRLDLNQVMSFLAVADERNFHRAAERVNLTQQAVSKSLQKLEERLGVRLVNRDRRSVSLTRFGELLLPHARAIVAEVGQIELNISHALGSGGGFLRVGATPTLLANILPRSLREVYGRRKNLSVIVERGSYLQLQEGLLEGRLDVVLSSEPTRTPDPLITLEPLWRDRYVVVASANHPALVERRDSHGPVSLSSLVDYPWLSLDDFPRAEADLRDAFAKVGLKPPAPALVSGSVLFALSWIQQSDFLCALPLQLATQEIEKGTLKRVPIDSGIAPWRLVLATRDRTTLTAAAHDFVEILRATASIDEA